MVIRRAKEAMFAAQITMEEYQNRNLREMKFEVGDKVWLSTKNLSKVHFTRGVRQEAKAALAQRHVGPYKILEQVSERTDIQIGLTTEGLPKITSSLSCLWHSLLWKDAVRGPGKEIKTGKDKKEDNRPLSEVIMIEEDEGTNFVPDKILEKRGNKYLIRWQGLDEASKYGCQKA